MTRHTEQSLVQEKPLARKTVEDFGSRAVPGNAEGSADAPRRVQLSRKKGWRMPPNTVKVDRSTKWGNPFNWKDLPAYSRDDDGDVTPISDNWRRFWATSDFAAAVKLDLGRPDTYPNNAEIARELRGKNLACWCGPNDHCHADVLLEIANTPPFVVHGEWVDPQPSGFGQPPRAHPYGFGAWCEMVDRHTVFFPNREAADQYSCAAKIAVAEARNRRNGGSSAPSPTAEGRRENPENTTLSEVS